MTAKQNHIHKLKRHIYSTGSKIFFCADGDCTFKIEVPLALGKRTICWRCGDPFEMNQYSLRLAKPHCLKCHESRAGNKSYVNSSTINKITEDSSRLLDEPESSYERRRVDRETESRLKLVGESSEPSSLSERLRSISNDSPKEAQRIEYREIEESEDDPEL